MTASGYLCASALPVRHAAAALLRRQWPGLSRPSTSCATAALLRLHDGWLC